MSAADGAARLAGRVALVTGASRGIGAAVAKRFAQEGATVVLVARTQGALEELDDAIRQAGHPQPVLVPGDLRDFEMIDKIGAALYQRFGRLDVLVANAGVLGMLAPVGHIDLKVWDETVAVNLTANWRLIRSLDPLLRLSEAGRGIFVTSGVTRGVFPYWGAYAATKAALEALVLTYAGELAKTKVKVNLLDPGVVRTRLRATAFPGEDASKLTPPEAITERFVELAEAGCLRQGERVRV
ncbi:MAG: SDR family NAD(P)-dependent oxidoreductase [Rhodospirillales bacterium]|nr:SDR family NAD(P)-dependent oxidoreductase [Rhodospirillales bacterium]